MLVHLLDRSLRLHVLDHWSICLLQHDQLVPVCQISFSYNLIGVTSHLDESARCSLITWRINLKVKDGTGSWIHSSISKTTSRFVLSSFEQEDNTWLDSHGLQKINLGLGVWESLHHPSVDSAIRLLKSFFFQWINDFIRDISALIKALANDLGGFWVLLNFTLQKLSS